MTTVKLEVSAAPLMVALESFLADIANRRCKVTEAFIDRFEALVESGGIDVKQTFAPDAGGLLLTLEVSDALAEFMATARAGDFDVV